MSVLSGALESRGWEIVLATLWQDETEYPLPPHTKRLQFSETKVSRAVLALKRLIWLRETIKAEKPDIVVSFMQKANYRAAAAMLGLGIPLLVSVRNDPKTDYGGLKNKLPNFIMTRKAKGCVFQTEEARGFFGKGFAERSRVIWNPLEEKFLKKDWNPEGSKGKNAFFIVNVGRITAQKNQLLLVKAFQRMLERLDRELSPTPVLLIYGKPEEGHGAYEELKKHIRENRLEEAVKLMGTTDQVEEVLANCAFFVLSSDYEGLPNGLMEAMAMGVPCVSTDCPCGGPGELIENGVNGILVPVGDEEKLADAMGDLLFDRAFAKSLGKKAKKLREKANVQVITEKWVELIQEACGA